MAAQTDAQELAQAKMRQARTFIEGAESDMRVANSLLAEARALLEEDK